MARMARARPWAAAIYWRTPDLERMGTKCPSRAPPLIESSRTQQPRKTGAVGAGLMALTSARNRALTGTQNQREVIVKAEIRQGYGAKSWAVRSRWTNILIPYTFHQLRHGQLEPAVPGETQAWFAIAIMHAFDHHRGIQHFPHRRERFRQRQDSIKPCILALFGLRSPIRQSLQILV